MYVLCRFNEVPTIKGLFRKFSIFWAPFGENTNVNIWHTKLLLGMFEQNFQNMYPRFSFGGRY